MTKEFLDLIKKVADRYGIKVTENADKGGIFYRNDNDELIEVTEQENSFIIEAFCMPINPFSIEENTFEPDNIMNFAA